MKKKINMHTFLICLDICIFSIILLSRRCCGADYRYESCVSVNCGNGPDIKFPFFVPGKQESYCGYPGFALNCSQSQGLPVLELSENEYAVEYIYYPNQSIRVYNSVLSAYDGGCRIRNTTLPTAQFSVGENVTEVYLFSKCSDLLSRNRDFCDRDLVLYDKNENFTKALKNCERYVVAPIEEGQKDDGGNTNVVDALRRGFLLDWTASYCGTCEDSGGRCGFNATTYQFKCFCPDRPHSRSCKHGKRRTMMILATAISGGGVFLLVSLLICVIICQYKNSHFLSRNITSDPTSKSDIERGSCYFGIPIFPYTELVEATNNFDSSKELGDGGFGTVYYGKLRDRREVAIKRLYENNCKRVDQFMNEIQILKSLRHHNLVSLYGCTSRTSKELLLVYEYIPNGTVDDHLHGLRAQTSPLTWSVRLSIAIQTASALSYLHKSDIIHRDVKTSNILLDNNFCVKLGDFGLSRLFPNDVTHVSTAPYGTPGYVDPEYHRCYQLTDKSDVYSFGVVLIELVSSMPAVDMERCSDEINLADLAVERIKRHALDELIDPSLGYERDDKVRRMTSLVLELAFRCLQAEKDLRPCMSEIVDCLNDIQGGVIEKIPVSPETDDVVLLKNKKNFQSSPIAVTDVWISTISAARSSVG